jgi:hypothetical protein
MIVVGAPGYALQAGAVFVFALTGGIFVNRQKLEVRPVARSSLRDEHCRNSVSREFLSHVVSVCSHRISREETFLATP